jgi:hypothetical protein
MFSSHPPFYLVAVLVFRADQPGVRVGGVATGGSVIVAVAVRVAVRVGVRVNSGAYVRVAVGSGGSVFVAV